MTYMTYCAHHQQERIVENKEFVYATTCFSIENDLSIFGCSLT